MLQLLIGGRVWNQQTILVACKKITVKQIIFRSEENVLFNDALNTFYLRLYGVGHMGYLFRLAPRSLLYTPSHRQDSTYHCLCYTSRGALAGMRNSSMGPP